VKNDNSALATNSHNPISDICLHLRDIGAVRGCDNDLKGGENPRTSEAKRMIKKVAALVVLVMVAAIFVAGCDNKNPTNTSAGVAVTVNAQTTRDQLGSYPLQSTPQPGYKYSVFNVTVTNLNKNNLAMGNPLYFKLTTNDGTVYSYSTSSYWLGNEINPVSGTNPGEKVTGQIAFEIPQSASPTQLTYNDGILGNIVTTNLG
jgi:predicted small secreted protein